MDTARYVVGVLVVTGLPPGLLWWFIVHPFVGFWRTYGAKVTLWVVAAVGIAGVAGLLVVRDLLLMRDLGTHGALVVVAALLLAVSGWIAVQRRRHLTMRILAGVPELEGEEGELLQDGIYARIRHPRYVEVVVGTWAYAVFANYVGAYLIAFLTIPVIHLIVVLEERELAERFGTRWEEYRSRVPRYVPRSG